MSTGKIKAKRPFVSVSARQQRPGWSKTVDLPLVVPTSLRSPDIVARWPTALGALRVLTDRDDLCAAYFRSAADFDLMVDRPVHTGDHLLIVVTQGDLVIESAGVPFALREGSSAVVAPGEWRLTEMSASGQAGYWLLFFGPRLLTEAIGDDEQAFQLASQVTPAYRGVFVQPRLLERLHAWGQATPVADVVQTIRAMAATRSASFYMYLREDYYLPRRRLQDEVHRRWLDGVGTLGRNWSGGPTVFRREFRYYHGVSANRWGTGHRRELLESHERSSTIRTDT